MKPLSIASICCLATLLTACKPAATWVDFSSTEGKFRASYPVQPREQSAEIKPAGFPITVHSMGIARNDGREYAVLWSDYPAPIMAVTTPEKILQGIHDGYQIDGKKILSESQVAVSGHPARELEADTGNGNITRLRVLLVEGRLYQVMTITPAATRTDPDLQKFFDSFALLP